MRQYFIACIVLISWFLLFEFCQKPDEKKEYISKEKAVCILKKYGLNYSVLATLNLQNEYTGLPLMISTQQFELFIKDYVKRSQNKTRVLPKEKALRIIEQYQQEDSAFWNSYRQNEHKRTAEENEKILISFLRRVNQRKTVSFIE